MSLTINTNIASIDAQRNLSGSQSSLATSMQRLSSGLRINSAKDDAAGLSIAERMNAQVRGMNVAIRNSNDGISLAQTADGALAQVSNSLQRMRELAVQARNSTNSSSDKDSLNKEFGQLQAEITRVLGGTTFNGKAMLGADATTLNFQVGANTTSNDTVSIKTVNMTTDTTMTAVTNTSTRRDRLVGHLGRHRHRDRQHRQGHRRRQRHPRHLRCDGKPLRLDHLEPAVGRREPDGRPQPHHGRRLRRRKPPT